MENSYEYNEYIDIAILEFLWTNISKKVTVAEVIEGALQMNEYQSFEEPNVKHHVIALLVERLVDIEEKVEPIYDSIISITPEGLKTLRISSILKESSSSLEVIYGHLVNNQNNL